MEARKITNNIYNVVEDKSVYQHTHTHTANAHLNTVQAKSDGVRTCAIK